MFLLLWKSFLPQLLPSLLFSYSFLFPDFPLRFFFFIILAHPTHFIVSPALSQSVWPFIHKLLLVVSSGMKPFAKRAQAEVCNFQTLVLWLIHAPKWKHLRRSIGLHEESWHGQEGGIFSWSSPNSNSRSRNKIQISESMFVVTIWKHHTWIMFQLLDMV